MAAPSTMTRGVDRAVKKCACSPVVPRIHVPTPAALMMRPTNSPVSAIAWSGIRRPPTRYVLAIGIPSPRSTVTTAGTARARANVPAPRAPSVVAMTSPASAVQAVDRRLVANVRDTFCASFMADPFWFDCLWFDCRRATPPALSTTRQAEAGGEVPGHDKQCNTSPESWR